jgi:hypothetical protein
MTLISEAWTVGRSIDPAGRSVTRALRQPQLPTIVERDGAVVALHRREVIALGGLESRAQMVGDRLVCAHDLDGRPCWVPAVAVWSDGDAAIRPERPRGVGLATDQDRARAVLGGLSDRLGWEAREARDRGRPLSRLNEAGVDTDSALWDGRLDHDVPTVLVTRDNVLRWGAGTTIAAAYRRALFGDRGNADVSRELADIALVLSAAGIGVGVVDLTTPLFAAAGISRVSVQLLAPAHDPVRRWDARPI